MVKDHSDSERGRLLLPLHGLFVSISSKESFIPSKECKPWRQMGGYNTEQVCFWKEGNILFNDALNTLYFWLYGIRDIVKDHSDTERKPATTT